MSGPEESSNSRPKSASPPPLEPGERMGPYRIERELEHGVWGCPRWANSRAKKPKGVSNEQKMAYSDSVLYNWGLMWFRGRPGDSGGG